MMWDTLLPSFLQKKASQDRHDEAHERPTAYLDGLRGLAALLVHVYHFTLPLDPHTRYGYGSDMSNSVFSLPLARLAHAGPAMVSIFFVISGYVLSERAVRLHRRNLRIRSRQDDMTLGQSLAAVLARAIVKRGLRLFLPAMATSAVVFVMVRLRLYDTDRLTRSFPEFHPPRPTRLSELSAQLNDWSRWVAQELTNPWDWESLKSSASATYASHLWTIPAEYRCSMVLFTVLLPLSQMRSGLGAGVIWASMLAYCAVWERWDMALFFMGLGLAVGDRRENSLEMPKESECETYHNMPTLSITRTDSIPRKVSQSLASGVASLLPLLALLTGAWLASYPDERGHEAAGFVLLGFISSSRHLWHAAGAILIVWSVRRVKAVKVLLLHSSLQYLGCISFSVYMIHEPILQVWGWWWAGWLKSTCATLTPWAPAAIVVLVAFCTVTTVIILVADYVWRLVDKPAVWSAKYVERYVFDFS